MTAVLRTIGKRSSPVCLLTPDRDHVCNTGHRRRDRYATLSYMAPTDREFRRLILHIERDLMAQASLRALLVAWDNTLARHRRGLRAVTARIKRARRTRPARQVSPAYGSRHPTTMSAALV